MTDHTPSGLPQPQTVADERAIIEACDAIRSVKYHPATAAYGETVRAILRALSAPAVETVAVQEAKACARCNGSGVVDDGEIDCYEDGTPYANGPVKCVKDCPACGGNCAATLPVAPKAEQAATQAEAREADDEFNRCTVCGRPVRYGERHHGCASTAPTGAQAEPTIKYVPINTNEYKRHPNDKEPRNDACEKALDDRGDSEGQGLDPYWKWGFRQGFNAAAEQAAPKALTADERQVVRDAIRDSAELVAGPKLATPPTGVEGAEPRMQIDLSEEEATFLRDMLTANDEAPEISFSIGQGHSGYGLYVWESEYPEEGASLLKALAAQPVAGHQGGEA